MTLRVGPSTVQGVASPRIRLTALQTKRERTTVPSTSPRDGGLRRVAGHLVVPQIAATGLLTDKVTLHATLIAALIGAGCAAVLSLVYEWIHEHRARTRRQREDLEREEWS